MTILWLIAGVAAYVVLVLAAGKFCALSGKGKGGE